MAQESQSSPEKPEQEELRWTPSLGELKSRIEMDNYSYQKIVDHLHLPITGFQLSAVLNEIASREEGREMQARIDEKTEDSLVSGEVAQINQQISAHYDEWYELLNVISRNPDMPLSQIEQEWSEKTGQEYSIKNLVSKMLWYGVEKEAALQKVEKIDSYHLPKNHALLALIATEVSQEYAEDFFNETRWKTIQDLLEQKDKAINVAKTKAADLVEKARKPLQEHLKGLTPDKQEKLFARMVKFLSEDDLGKKLVEMADGIPGSTVVKGGVGSLKATASGVKEGLFSPLCACMMAVMLDGAEDKEKVFIQYVTFLVAGQLVQEGGKWVAKGGAQGLAYLLEDVARKSPKGSNLAKIHAFLKNGSPNKHLVLLATIALVVGVFQIPMVTDFIGDIANAIDENIPHGDMRELTIGGVSAVAYLMQFSTKRFLPIAVLVEGTQVVMDEVNPYAEQDQFLFDYITGKSSHIVRAGEQLVRDPLTAWNERVDDQKIPGNATQEAILGHSRIAHPREWALRTIVPFRQELTEYELAESQLRTVLENPLSLSPTTAETITLLSDTDILRYREYALAGTDIWHTRDDQGRKILQRDPHEMSTIDKHLRYNPVTGITPAIARYMGWGNLSGRNDKALDRLDDVQGSLENKLDEFFEHECDALIAREKEKCKRMITPGTGFVDGAYLSPPVYELDPEAYKKIEPWVKQMEVTKELWKNMRATADALARKVVMARGLGVYDENIWTAPGKEGNPLMPPEEGEKPTMAFDGMMYLIEERADILELAEPTTGRAARELIEMLGYEKPRYGTNNLSPTVMKERYDADLEANPGIYQFMSLDRRDLALQNLAGFAEAAFGTGVPIEYLQLALEPITKKVKNLSGYDPKTSDKEMWITPELAHTVQGNIAKYILDHAAREGAISSGKMQFFEGPEIQLKFGGYTLRRTYVFSDAGTNNPQIRAQDVVISEAGVGEMGERPPFQEFYHEWEPLAQYKNGLHQDLLTALHEKYTSEKLMVEAEIQKALQDEKNIAQEIPKVWE